MEALKYDRQKNEAINFSLSHPSLRNPRMLSFRLFYPVMQATGIKLFVVRSTKDPRWKTSFTLIFFFLRVIFRKIFFVMHLLIAAIFVVHLEKRKLGEVYLLIRDCYINMKIMFLCKLYCSSESLILTLEIGEGRSSLE